VRDVRFSRVSATPLPQRAGPQRSPILGVPFYLSVHSLTQNYRICRGNIWRRGLVWGSATPPSEGGGAPALPNFGGSLLFMRTPFVIELPKVACGQGHVSWGQHRLHSKSAVLHRSPILGVLPYLCLHPLTENGQTGHGNTYGEGCVSGVQPRHFLCTTHMRRAVCQRQLSFL